MAGESDDTLSTTGVGRAEATGEFFSVGAPLHAVRAGYVKRRADDVLYETVVAGRYAHVIAPDRSGKSSLIAATAARLEANGLRVAILDLEQIGVRDSGKDAGRWYYNVAYRLLRQLRIRIDLQDWWQDKAILSNRQRLFEFYAEVILQHVPERIVVFIDEIQCIEQLPFADQLLASIRTAHNARATDPEFSRLAFVLLGECDPLSLIEQEELSPFNITQPVTLTDFARDDLNLFATELNLAPEDAEVALDRVFYWTGGQPYLSQKLARSIARETPASDIAEAVDRIVAQQLAGRAALHNEPHMSHIHREVMRESKLREPLLNLYGSICKGIVVAADLGSPLQRRLLATGLVVVDSDGNLKVRNRIYERVFTTRWANENLPIRWRAPAVAAGLLFVMAAIPFWYTQLLPKPYVAVLTAAAAPLPAVEEAYNDLRSFPGHRDTAERLFRQALQTRAARATEGGEIEAIAAIAAKLPAPARFSDSLRAGFWDRRAREAMQREQRDAALLASLEALVMSTPRRRTRAAGLVGADYPLLLASLPAQGAGSLRFNPDSLLLTEVQGSRVRQWTLSQQTLAAREPWTITALEVPPLVRRVAVDQPGTVRRIGLTLDLSHARIADLRIKLIAPSGRAVEVDPGVERAAAGDSLRIPAEQLRELVGEMQTGTWSLSIRDEITGVAGQLVGWELRLNAQGLVEGFERGLNVADPLERDADEVWTSGDGRFAIARATQSDNARVWDLVFAKPIRAVPVTENERLIGLSAGARHLVTATQDTVNLWDTATGDRIAVLAIGAGASTIRLTSDGHRVVVERRGDELTRLERWSIETATADAVLEIAGTPAIVALDQGATRIAIADYDRAVRIWDFEVRSILAQIDLGRQPAEIRLNPQGDVLGAVFQGEGAALWRVDAPLYPVVEDRGSGRWQLAFSPSGTIALLGRSQTGSQLYRSRDGRALGPALGLGGDPNLLAFSADEQTIVTSGSNSAARFWRAPSLPAADAPQSPGAVPEAFWPRSGDVICAVTPDATALLIGDRNGDVHVLSAGADRDALLKAVGDVSYVGHKRPIRILTLSADGSVAASVADDNTVRVWDTGEGLPRSFFTEVPGNAVRAIAFSPDAKLLGIVNGNLAQVMDAASGDMVATFDVGEPHPGIAFADADRLYIGSVSGSLRAVTRDTSGSFSVSTLWQGGIGIRWLAAAPNTQLLVLVTTANLAQLFDLEALRIGERTLTLPAAVEDVAFSPTGSRVLFRTPRWVHRASASATGLIWLDALLAPPVLAGARIVFGDASANADRALGNRVYVPVADDGVPGLRELDFVNRTGPVLFGNKDQLLSDWRTRLGYAAVNEVP